MACGGWGDTAAAYRLHWNGPCDWREVLEAHGRSSEERLQQHPMVLCLNDTTEQGFNGQVIDGLGPLSCEAQRGMYLHPTYAVSVNHEPLDVLDAWMWARELRDAESQRGGISESLRWIESCQWHLNNPLRVGKIELPLTRATSGWSSGPPACRIRAWCEWAIS